MKHLLLILSLLISTVFISQTNTQKVATTEKYTLTKAQLNQAQTINDLVPEVDAADSLLQYNITFMVEGSVKSHVGTGIRLAASTRHYISKVSVGSKIFLDINPYSKSKKTARSYSIYIDR